MKDIYIYIHVFINLRELFTVIYFFLGAATEATPHYPTVELRVFRRLGFMLEAKLY